ncbi:ATP-binding protein [Nocardioides sp. TF02-7]|uniref:sensor histidine kinase n=1 Tax=Nocardioides sp. TF02-7 TaxID=2917724 RepID=UPI001F05F870|nr:ATP-binding protein [Nocardioides sp. TF02-7]UMG92597.1 ATP-binding protein [Nocardioides sp. TF02-7]
MQVLTNLVENGVRHGAGDVTVTVAPADPGYVGVTVTDEGEGIPAELRQQVFTKFWTIGRGGGSGLGLYIVNGLVRAQGGTVTIDDRPGGGSGGHGDVAGRRPLIPVGLAGPPVPRLPLCPDPTPTTTPWKSPPCSPRRSRPPARRPSPRSPRPRTSTS